MGTRAAQARLGRLGVEVARGREAQGAEGTATLKLVYDAGRIQIFNGDCQEVMAAMDAESVTAVVCDPPYGLSFMGKAWDHGVPSSEVWAEALRVTKPGGMLLAFGGTRTYHRLACAIEDAGWEIRDCLSWLYGSGFPKSLDVSKAIAKAAGAKREKVPATGGLHKNANLNDDGWSKIGEANPTMDGMTPSTDAAREWQGYGTALKPAWEPIIMAMKPLDGTFAKNAIAHGVAGVNVDGCRVPGGMDDTAASWAAKGSGGKDSKHMGQKNQAMRDAYRRGDIPLPTGRFPANLVLDEDAAAMLDEQSGDLNNGKTRVGIPGGNTFGRSVTEFNRSGVGVWPGGFGGASRFFYTSKSSKADRTADGWAANDHPTVKPVSLMRWLVRMVTMPEGTVILDPFMGSGSTLVAARDESVAAIGIDIEKTYCEIAAKRLSQGAFNFS